MKMFNVCLRDGRTVKVQANGYHLDSDQYVFDRGDAEVHFFKSEDVSGIFEVPMPHLEAVHVENRGRAWPL